MHGRAECNVLASALGRDAFPLGVRGAEPEHMRVPLLDRVAGVDDDIRLSDDRLVVERGGR